MKLLDPLSLIVTGSLARLTIACCGPLVFDSSSLLNTIELVGAGKAPP